MPSRRTFPEYWVPDFQNTMSFKFVIQICDPFNIIIVRKTNKLAASILRPMSARDVRITQICN